MIIVLFVMRIVLGVKATTLLDPERYSIDQLNVIPTLILDAAIVFPDKITLLPDVMDVVENSAARASIYHSIFPTALTFFVMNEFLEISMILPVDSDMVLEKDPSIYQ